MEQPLVFFVIVGVALLLIFYYGGATIFNSGPIATGPGGGLESPSAPPPLSFGETTPSEQQTLQRKAGISPFQGAVYISTINYSDSDFNKEYFIIRSGGFLGFGDNKKTVDLNGWTIENNRGERYVIPAAFNIPYLDLAPQPIQLNSGEEVVVATGDSPNGFSFRENICTGYLNESYSFTPTLDESCPEFLRDDLLRQKLNAACIDVIERTARCRQVKIAFEESAAGNDCIAFAGAHLTYDGCVRDNKNTDRFFTGRWRVFLRIHQKIWNPTHDRAILRDKDGLIVDEYLY